MRFAALALLAALAVGPFGSLPAHEKCCPMAGMKGIEGMACCELGADTGSSCQIRQCGPGSDADVLSVGYRAETALELSPLPAPSATASATLSVPDLPVFEPAPPPVPPPRA